MAKLDLEPLDLEPIDEDRTPSPAAVVSNFLKERDSDFVPDLPKSPAQAVRTAASPFSPRSIDTPMTRRVAGDVLAGAAGTAGGVGGAMRWLGFEEAGRAISDFSDKVSREVVPEDPNFVDGIMQGFGSMATFYVPGIGVASGAANLARVAPRLATLFGVGTASLLESLTEAGAVYNESLARNEPQEYAVNNANLAFWANLPVVAISNYSGGLFEKAGGRQIYETLKSGGTEALQEMVQQYFSNLALADPAMKDVLMSGLVGAVTGGGIKALAGVDAGGQTVPALPGVSPIQEPPLPAPEVAPAPPPSAPQAAPVPAVPVQPPAADVLPVLPPVPPSPEAIQAGAAFPASTGGSGASIEISPETPPLRLEPLTEPVNENSLDLEPVPATETETPPSDPPKEPPVDAVATVPPAEEPGPGDKAPSETVLHQQVQDAQAYPKSKVGLKFLKKGPKTITERQALNRSLERQSQAARQGSFSERLRLNSVKRKLADFVKEKLPETERGAFLSRVANVSTPEQANQIREEVLSNARKLEDRGPRLYTERQALRQSLRRQARAAVRAAAQTKQDLDKVKSEIVMTLRENLPLLERARFISSIAHATKGKDVAKLTARVIDRMVELDKKALVSEVKTRVKKALDTDSLDVFYKQKIREAVEGLEFKNVTYDTAQKIKKIEDAIREQSAQGKEVWLPARILQSFRMLKRKSVESLDVKELMNLRDKINLLINLAKQSQITRLTAYQEERAGRAAQLIGGTKPISRKPLIEHEPGKEVPTKTIISNMIAKAQNQARRIDHVITPMDAIVDELDGNEDYQGVNARVIKQTIDTDYGNYLDDVDGWVRPVQDLAEKLGLKDHNFERISIHAYRGQKGGRDYLRNNGMTDQQIDAVDLTPSEMKVFEEMRRVIEEPYHQVKELRHELYNEDLDKVENYFPVQVDFDKVSDIEVFQRVGDLMTADAFGKKTKTVQQGFTEKRVGTKKAIRLNAMEVFTRHMDDVAYLVNMQRDIKMFSEIVNSPRYQEAAGDLGGLIMSQWMDTLARKGGSEAYKRIRILDTLRRNVGAARIGLKLSSILIQPTALFDGAALVGGEYVSKGAAAVILNREWRQFMRDHFPELRARGADDPAYLELPENRLMRKAQGVGFSALQKMDMITASGVAAGAYIKSLESRGIPIDLSNPDPEGVKEATLMMRRTQSSPSFKDLPLAMTRGQLTGSKSLDKLIFQFQSFMLNRWSLVRHDAWRAGVREGNPRKAAQIYGWLALAQVAETGIRLGTKAFWLALLGAGSKKAWEEIGNEFDDIPGDMLIDIMGSVPILGQIVRMAAYDSEPAPVLASIKDVTGGLRTAVTGKSATTKTKGVVKSAEGALSLVGVPGTSQAGQIIRDAIDLNKKNAAKGKSRLSSILSGGRLKSNLGGGLP